MCRRWKSLVCLCLLLLFHASRTQRCSCSRSESFSADLVHGEFKSPGFPRNYCDDLQCAYEIEPKENAAVALNVEHFATELLHDYLEVAQLAIINGKHVAIRQEIMSGTELVRTSFTSAIGVGFRFVFHSDSSDHNYAGFKISFVRFRKGSRHHTPCPFPYVDAKDAFASVEQLQSRHASCIIRINSTESIQLNVDEVSSNVNLKIFDTENFDHRRKNFAVLKEIHGFASDQWPFEVVSRSLSVSIIITTSRSLSSSPAPTYRIRYRKVPSPCACPPSLLTVDKCGAGSGNGSVQLSSPGFPLEYCDNIKCETNFVQNPSCASGHFRIKFNVFETEPDSDYVAIKAPSELLRLSHRAKNIGYFSVCAANFSIATVTDHSVTEKGYNLLVEQADTEDCSCSGGPFVIPPSQEKARREETIRGNCHFVDRFWRFDPPDSAKTAHRFVIKLEYDLFAENEFLEISNGESTFRNRDVHRLTANDVQDGERGQSNLELKSQTRDSLQPVYVWYHRESLAEGDPELSTPRRLNFEFGWEEECKCGQSRRDAAAEEWRALTSPDYPEEYCNDVSCTWHLVAPEGHRVVVNITDVETEFGQDFLGLFNGNDTNGAHIELISGVASFDYRIQSTGNELTVMFESDVSIRSRGFKLLFKAEPLEPVSEEVERSGGLRVFMLVVILLFVGGALGMAYLVKRFFDRRRMHVGDDSLIEYTTSNLRALIQKDRNTRLQLKAGTILQRVVKLHQKDSSTNAQAIIVAFKMNGILESSHFTLKRDPKDYTGNTLDITAGFEDDAPAKLEEMRIIGLCHLEDANFKPDSEPGIFQITDDDLGSKLKAAQKELEDAKKKLEDLTCETFYWKILSAVCLICVILSVFPVVKIGRFEI